ncbi:MAG: serine/threonine-protein kinase [Deltaproteobacteria bacterium]|nr:serine/threonine-protein kinase [Deltaproteobacteria bacterium]
MFGDDDAEPEVDPSESQLSPTPGVVGADRIRAALRARMFGDDSSPPGDDDDVQRNHASQSGVIGGLDTHPSGGARRVDGEEPELAGRIGRFRVLDRLGRGGMGVVYSAYDPELDRKVAIKLLRADVREGMAQRDAHARLLREAQAMARLSDPNVIVVHEVGMVDDRVFVAMEYIDGLTLGQWLADSRRRWRAVLDVFLKAGSGLAAAHRAELAHRDFKPDNVLLGHDGRVRVLDFGLARSLTDDEPTASMGIPLRERPELDTLNTPLTRTGAVMGTPAYMSPEQYMGYPANAQSDQFSFCVALYEGLYGVRPFVGSSLSELSTNVVEGNVRETPGEARVPKRLLTALRRGMSVKPADRYPSMEALLTELRRDPLRKWRWGGMVLGVGTLASVATFAATRGTDASDACTGLERRLDGVWDDQARASIVGAIEGTGLDYAPRVAATSVRLLDEYAQQWVGMAKDTCGAGLVAKEGDTEHLRKQNCLDQRLNEVDALVEALGESDPGLAEAAVKATTSLTNGLSACADPRRLMVYDDAGDPALGRKLAAAHARLAKSNALRVLGNYERASELATEVIEEAQAAGAGPLEARGMLIRGSSYERMDQLDKAEADLKEAIALAERHGDPATRGESLVVLIYVIGQDRSRYEEAKDKGRQARDVLVYIDADPLLFADLDNNLGVAARLAGDMDKALEFHRSSHLLRVGLLGSDHPDISRSLLNIGISLGTDSKYHAEAEGYLRDALANAEQNLGSQHPLVGTALTNLGNCLARQGRFQDAMPLQRRAFEVFERAFGPDHVATMRVVFNLAKMLEDTGAHEEAAAMFRRGLQSRERELDPDDVRLTGWVSHLARSEMALGHFDVATPLFERSLGFRVRSGDSPMSMARDQVRLAEALGNSDLARSRALIVEARNALVERVAEKGGRGEAHEEVVKWLDRAEAWLAAHPEHDGAGP